MEDDKIIPVCFALDEGYIMPTTVAIYSLVDKLAIYSKAHIFLMVPTEFDEKKASLLLELKANRKVYKMDIIHVSDERLNGKATVGHITFPTFYRLVMDKFIPYEKCIYFDGDILVMQDITELYDILLEDNYIAGVTTPYSQLKKKNKKEAMARLGIDSYSHYVNAGVLVFNLDKIRRFKMSDKFLSVLDEDFPMRDQDILNSVCFPNIKVISCKFNAVKGIFTYRENMLRTIYSETDLREAKTLPVIFHFADKYKPWKYYNQKYEKEWFDLYSKIYIEKLDRKEYKSSVIIDNLKKISRFR